MLAHAYMYKAIDTQNCMREVQNASTKYAQFLFEYLVYSVSFNSIFMQGSWYTLSARTCAKTSSKCILIIVVTCMYMPYID